MVCFLSEVIQHVTPLVYLAALDWRRFAGILLHRRMQCLAAIQKMSSASSDEERYQQLSAPDGLTGPDTAAVLDRLAQLIDLAGHLRHEDGIDRALTVCRELLQRNLPADTQGLINYFAANAWQYRWELRVNLLSFEHNLPRPDAGGTRGLSLSDDQHRK